MVVNEQESKSLSFTKSKITTLIYFCFVFVISESTRGI